MFNVDMFDMYYGWKMSIPGADSWEVLWASFALAEAYVAV